MRLFLSFLLFSISLGLNAQTPSKVVWYDWDSGYKTAVTNKKIVFVDVYRNYCKFCAKMDAYTFSDPDVATLLNNDFIAIKINPEIEEKVYQYEGKFYSGTQLMAVLNQGQKLIYPSVIMFAPDDDDIYYQTGYQDASNLKSILQAYLKIKSKGKKS